jgi:mono/diheme cytochrome c family protein
MRKPAGPHRVPETYPSLRDDQVADVLTYVRASWGNSAPPVFEDHVAASRGNFLW